MSTKTYPYIYDVIAGFLTFSILILSNFLSRGENIYLKIIGVICLLFAGLIWVFPFIHLKKYGDVKKGSSYYDTNTIADKGIYGIVRHPQYLAYMLLTSGFTLLYQNWIIVLIAIIAIVLFYYHTLREEKELTDKFNVQYLDYCKRVPRFNVMKGIINRIRSSKGEIY